MVIALVLSGGTGMRMGIDIPKQYIEVAGKKIIDYCLDVFQMCDEVDLIQIVAEPKWVNILDLKKYSKFRGTSQPGRTRQESVLNGLKDILDYAAEDDVVIVHDAARPSVAEKMLRELIEETQDHDGVIPVLPMKDTLYFSEDGEKITSLLERKCIYAGQAPEAFRLGAYFEANKALSEEELLKINGSTEPAFMAGLDIVMIPGDERNFKITTKEDLRRFKKIVNEKT